MNAILLAGGFGTRLKPLTSVIPKPAVEIGGKPIIKHIIKWLKDVGFDDIVVKLYYMAEDVKAAAADPFLTYVTTTYQVPTAEFLKMKEQEQKDNE